MNKKVLVRDRIWRVKSSSPESNGHKLLTLEDPIEGETIQIISPPEEVAYISNGSPSFHKNDLSPWLPWSLAHRALDFSTIKQNQTFSVCAGRILPEPYQFVPARKMFEGRKSKPSILIADDVGLGKTVEAGICMMELMARGRGKRVLLIVPPGLIQQWQDEMFDKFGLVFDLIENAGAASRIQTTLAEGIKPWTFLDRVITSVEYLKKVEVYTNAFSVPWDIIVVDESHYLAESGTPRNPELTKRSKLGQRLRDATNAIILLSATPHNGYSHSFRSLLEIVEPTDATFEGDIEDIRERVERNMVRRLKHQIWKYDHSGKKICAFCLRDPVSPIEVRDVSKDEKAIFSEVSSYCSKAVKNASNEEEKHIVSFTMQIIKKRMLSSRNALQKTVKNRLDALSSRIEEEPPPRSEIKELQSYLPLPEIMQERIAQKFIRASIPKDARRKQSEKKQLEKINTLLKKVTSLPDPKIKALLATLHDEVLNVPKEKAIIFTEYRDTMEAIRDAFQKDPLICKAFVELTGGLSLKQRRERIERFERSETRILLATDAASEGLNLQKSCRRIYHFELPWNPNRMEQRNGRVDRHGQERTPIIRYLYYPDCGEDKILGRLVARIEQMQKDKVSTPDILGICEGIRIEERLTEMDAEEPSSHEIDQMFEDIESNRRQFQKSLSPLLTVSDKDTPTNDCSAEPLMTDDEEFEKFLLRYLNLVAKDHLKPLSGSETFSLSTPHHLVKQFVKEQYPCLTFKRSVAIRNSATDMEFITKLHPLFKAIVDEAYNMLTLSHTHRTDGKRLAVRRHPMAKDKPYAIFSFLARHIPPSGELILIPVDTMGRLLDEKYAQVIFDEKTPCGEVSWEEMEKYFADGFTQAQQSATGVTEKRLIEIFQKEKCERTKTAKILRQDAEKYLSDKLKEIKKEEQEIQISVKDNEQGQMLLPQGRDTAIFNKKRSVAKDRYKNRLKEIEDFEVNISEPLLQALGVAFIFPSNND